MTQAEYTPWLKHQVKSSPRVGDALSDYVNSEDTRKALNIPKSVQAWE